MKLELTEKEISVIQTALIIYEDLPEASEEQYYISQNIQKKIRENKVETNEMWIMWIVGNMWINWYIIIIYNY